jgi:hypothetical protein
MLAGDGINAAIGGLQSLFSGNVRNLLTIQVVFGSDRKKTTGFSISRFHGSGAIHN